MHRSFLLFTLLTLSLGQPSDSHAQFNGDRWQAGAIDLKRVPTHKVRKRLRQQMVGDIKNLSQLKATCCEGIDTENLQAQERVYFYPQPIEKIWKFYTEFIPTELWVGKMNTFALLYSETQDQYYYPDSKKFPQPEEGQVVFIRLRLLGGIIKVAVGLKYSKISHLEKTLEFDYLEGGKSVGRQQIKLEEAVNELGETVTRVIHTTQYFGQSRLRLKLYPYFHRVATDEFHKNIHRNGREMDQKSTDTITENN